MNTIIQEIHGNMVAMLEGRLDTAASPETEKAMQPLYDCENQDIIIDCTKLEYISSSGLRIFLSVLKSTPSTELNTGLPSSTSIVSKDKQLENGLLGISSKLPNSVFLIVLGMIIFLMVLFDPNNSSTIVVTV